MTTKQVADRLVALCREGKAEEAINELYSDDIVSTEVNGTDSPEMPRQMKGIDAIRGKAKWWFDNHIVHSNSAEGPLVSGDYFSVAFKYDVTHKPNNMRYVIEEIAVYCVKNGTIVDEQFFYLME